MLTDIKGFTSKTAGFSRAQTQEMLAKHRELVLPVVERFHGRLVKTIGDAFLVAFDSPTDAVLCGVEIQTVLRGHNAGKDHPQKIEIRIAINAGEVAIHDDGDIYGDAVNITSRLESIAEAGEVFFTEAVYLAMNKKEVPSSEIGYRQFKGIAEKIKVYRVLRETPIGANAAEGPAVLPGTEAPPAAPPRAARQDECPAGFWRRLISLLLDACIFAMVLNTLSLTSCGPNVKVRSGETFLPKKTAVDQVALGSAGLTIKGKNGETIAITKAGGVSITNPAHPEGKLLRTSGGEAGFDTGLRDGDKKYAPVKMLLWALYCAIMLWRFGATAGMMVMKLKVVDAATGAPLGTDKAFLRAFFSLVSFSAAGLGYVWAVWEKDKLTWHDLLAGSKIIMLRKNTAAGTAQERREA